MLNHHSAAQPGGFLSIGDHLCPNGIDHAFTSATTHDRYAQFFMEDVTFNNESRDWMYPLATVYDYSTTSVAHSTDCDLFNSPPDTDTRRDRIAQAVAPAKPLQLLDSGGFAVGGVSVPRCGVQQRVWNWNQPCGKVTDLLCITPDELGPVGTPNPTSGWYMNETHPQPIDPQFYPPQSKCTIRERRVLKRTCPEGMGCAANGECVAGGEEPDLQLVTARPAQAQ